MSGLPVFSGALATHQAERPLSGPENGVLRWRVVRQASGIGLPRL